MNYRPEIDGLRAIAVIPVVFFHANLFGFTGGYVGVDVFFVISGYLITSIILSEKEKGTFSLVTFYERRARRILPILFFVILACLPMAWIYLLPSDFLTFSKSLVSVVLFVSNIFFWQEVSYWNPSSELQPLLHTWSLSVEEQYYVVFPLFLMAMWRYRKRWILGSFMLVAVISLATSHWAAFRYPTAAFYLLITRGWELAIGAAIAFYFLYRKNYIELIRANTYLDEILSLFGLCLILYAVLAYDKSIPIPSLYALVPTVGAGLIIVFTSTDTIVGRLLSSRLLLLVGLTSYSIYLWHQPLLSFYRYVNIGEPSEKIKIIIVILTLVLSYFTWRFIEKPFRSKDIVSRKTIFLFSFISGIVFLSIGSISILNDGFKSRFPDVDERNMGVVQSFENGLSCFERLHNFCGENNIGKKQDLFVLGDSVMQPIAYTLRVNLDADKYNVINISSAGCLVIKYTTLYRNGIPDKVCTEKRFRRIEELLQKSSNPIVIWGGMTPKVLTGKWYQAENDKTTHIDSITRSELWNGQFINEHMMPIDLPNQITETLQTLKTLSSKLIIVYPIPEFGVHVGRIHQKRLALNSTKLIQTSMTRYTQRTKTTFDILNSIKGDNVLRYFPHKVLCDDAICYAESKNENYIADYNHLSESGAQLIYEDLKRHLN